MDQDTKHLEMNLGESVPLKVGVVQSQVKFLQGKVLTIIDASFTDKVQRKAVKTLINKAFNDQLTYIWNLCWPGTEFMTRDKAESVLDDIEKIEREAEEVPITELFSENKA